MDSPDPRIYGWKAGSIGGASHSAQVKEIDLLSEIRNLLVEIKDLLDTDTV